MCAGISISKVGTRPQQGGHRTFANEDGPLSDKFPFRYSGVPIVSKTFRSFSDMCR